MKLLPCVFVTCLAVGLAAGVSRAADTNKDKIVGTWAVTKSAGGLPKGATVQFTKDGKLKLNAEIDGKALKLTGTYKVDGDKLTTSLRGPDGKDHEETMTIAKLTDTVLHTKDAKGKIDEFKKK